MAKRPILDHPEIGDEAHSPFKAGAEKWPEIGYWAGVGCCAGGALVSAVTAAIAASLKDNSQWLGAIGGVLGVLSLVLMCVAALVFHLGWIARKRRVEEHNAKLRGWERQVREDARDELESEIREKCETRFNTEREHLNARFEADTRSATVRLEAERNSIIAQTRKTVENEIQAAREAEYRVAIAEWTPDVVGAHIGVHIAGMALWAADRDSGKPVLWIEVVLYSAAKVACDVVLETATCRLYTLPAPGTMICELTAKENKVSFDGSLRPGTITATRSMRLALTDDVVKELRATARQGADVVIELQVAFWFAGVRYPLQTRAPIYRALTLPPEWRH